MPGKLLPLAFVLALVVAACAEPPAPEVEFGSGVRFVPMVADSLNDAGVDPSVVVTDEGLPIVAYFAFEEAVEEGELVQTRPVGAPSIPGVMMATVNEEGIWTRGAIALEAEIPNVQIPFNPGFLPAIANLTPRNVTGLDLAVVGDTFHAVWGSAGVYYATGSTDPNATEQVQISKVSGTPAVGISIAVVGGTPRIAYYTSRSSFASVELATATGDTWSVETVATAGGCDTCTTAVVAADGGPVVAYSDGGSGVSVATSDGPDGWQSVGVGGGSGGAGLSAAATGDGVVVSYFDDEQVTVATGGPGSFRTRAVSEVASGSDESEGAGTSIAVDDAGTVWVAWTDAREGVRFASGDGETFTPIETGADTATGAMPSLDVGADGETAYLAWYDTEHQDMLVGAYGDIEGLALAEPSPEQTGAPAPSAPSTDGQCTQPTDGIVAVVAENISFDTSCIEVPAGEPFQIDFTNEDPDQHNVSIYPSPDDLQNPILQETPFGGPDSVTYDVPALDAGEYYFQCDVHPTIMTGTVRVSEGGGDGGGGGGGGGGAVTVTAENIAFDTDTITLAADQETTLTFINNDPDQHNVAIYPSADEVSPDAALFQGEIFSGPDEREYAIPPLDAGEYYFQCDVHPTIMTGTVSVE